MLQISDFHHNDRPLPLSTFQERLAIMRSHSGLSEQRLLGMEESFILHTLLDSFPAFSADFQNQKYVKFFASLSIHPEETE